MRPDEMIDALAATQHGVVARAQLLSAAMTARMIDHRVGSGRLVRLHAGVYAVRGIPTTWHQGMMAAYLAGGQGAAASHRAAGYLLRLDGVRPALELTVPINRLARLTGVIVHRAGVSWSDVDRTAVLPQTRPARTIVDLAAVLGTDDLERALDDALTRRLVTCEYLVRRLTAVGRQGRRGTVVLQQLLAARQGGRGHTESEFERRLLRLLLAAGLPRPVLQHQVVLPDGTVRRLDCSWPPAFVALDADSYRHHSSGRDWASDHVRNRALVAMGWRILPVTWGDLADPGPLLAAVHRSLNVLPHPA